MEKVPRLAPIIRNIELDWTGPIKFTQGQTVDFWRINAFTGFPDHDLGPCTSKYANSINSPPNWMQWIALEYCDLVVFIGVKGAWFGTLEVIENTKYVGVEQIFINYGSIFVLLFLFLFSSVLLLYDGVINIQRSHIFLFIFTCTSSIKV